ncbi:hypothetical protein HMPREF1551_01079 [Capnocytophaga sp. oral taxon 863 str. F0517]|nr:hypothetical protein HMPREF1551_01079 [Capnocytophaga sp. oral taxon 863 str. F0517]
MVLNRIFAEEKQTATYYISSSYQNKVLRTTKGEDDSKKIIYLFGKKDKTGLRLTLRSVCKAEDTVFHSLKGLIGFPAL